MKNLSDLTDSELLLWLNFFKNNDIYNDNYCKKNIDLIQKEIRQRTKNISEFNK